MKAALIGVGQAGGKVAQALAAYDERAGFDAVRGVLAVNSARTDLQSLDVPTMLVGQERVKGQGVGGDNELGAQVMDEDWREVLGSLDGTITSETEAVVVVAGLGGGTGSGGAPVLVDRLQEVYDVPIYALGVLPGHDEGAMYQKNAARSLKTLERDADAVLVVANDAWHSSGESVTGAFDAINDAIARRVGLLLGSGEITEGVGESVVDSSEIINTLAGGGVATVGYASAEASEDAGENVNVVTSATRRATLTSMSVPDATTGAAALVVVAGDPERISRKGVERARRWVEDETGSMAVRGGDFPLDTDEIAVLVLLAGVDGSDYLDTFRERARQAADQPDRDDPSEAFATDDLDGLL
jgi:cell division GTPase FtsZ